MRSVAACTALEKNNIYIIVTPPTVGVPGTGGDFVQPVDNTFVFNVGASRVCRAAFIFDDNRFELTEQFQVLFTGIILPDGMATPSVPGLTVQPATTIVLIQDNDGTVM